MANILKINWEEAEKKYNHTSMSEDYKNALLEQHKKKKEEQKANKQQKIVTTEKNEKESSIANIKQFPPTWYRYNKDGEIVKFISGKFVDFLAEHVKAVCVNDDFYLYEDGYYKKTPDEILLGYIQEHIDSNIRTFSLMQDVLKQWKTNRKVVKREEELNKNKFLLNLKNGIYDLETNTFTEGHTPDELITIRINANYNEALTREDGQTFHKFLDFALPDPQVQMVLQEIMGYCISQFVEAQKFFVFDGVSDSGKSLIISLIESLLAPENISHVRLQDLQGFHLADLHNKVLNTFADLDARAITDGNIIKALTGEDVITADRKHKTGIVFKNKAKFLFSTNGMPKNYGDKSDAFFRRLIIIPFKNQVKDEEKDPLLFHKLQKEKDYIFMWALEGLKRLIKERFQFTKSEQIQRKVQAYQEESNSLLQFINDCCELDPNGYVHSRWFMDFYKEYCRDELEIEPMKRKTVFKYLTDNFSIEYGDNIRVPGTRDRALKGIRLLKESEK
ncbi:DNA primase family protein [Anoxybacillus gonensis]|uniref:DNA primase family protein n=1 Tax=Anoxybacillus gonensis TaxID=198467 RepID=UPI0002BE2322|nr:phage/plasmid primase, P4 family [Anoxybacillus gonensis]EMI11397.1 primase [Anoxybacillus gonensis]